MAHARIGNRASVESKDGIWAAWKTTRNQMLVEWADGPARVSTSVSTKLSEKVVLVSEDKKRGADIFVGIEYSTHVTINCPQTDEGILQAKAIATEMAQEGNLEWMSYLEGEVRRYLWDKKFGKSDG